MTGSTSSPQPARASGTLTLGAPDADPLVVRRLGFGAMRITGPGIWGEPADRAAAVALCRTAVELGIDFVDTADSYGPHVSEEILREALHPYAGPDGPVVVATKGGLTRSGPNRWEPVGRPEYLRQCVHLSLRRLGVERLDLWQLHRFDPQVPALETLEAVAALQREGLIRHVGLSEVTVEQVELARGVLPVVSVQNLYNLANRQSEQVLEHCEAHGIAFIPWFPVAAGELARPGSVLDAMARETGATPAQLSLAWLLRRSPVMLPIPGTSSEAHLRDNTDAALLTLTDEQYAALTALGQAT